MIIPMRSLILVPMLLVPAAIAVAETSGASAAAGAYSADQAEKGSTQYAAHCASCHGAELKGSDAVPPLSGAQFGGNWKGGTAGDLAERIHTTMPMDNPGSLDAAAVAEVTAFILSKNGYPAGKTPLPTDPALQKNVKLD